VWAVLKKKLGRVGRRRGRSSRRACARGSATVCGEDRADRVGPLHRDTGASAWELSTVLIVRARGRERAGGMREGNRCR
jgi:hypothetical protein